MRPFWKQTTAQGSAVFGPIQATSSEETSVSMGRISGKRQFLDLDTSASNTTELHCHKLTRFLLYKWFFQCVLLDFEFGWRGAQVGFSVSILGAEVTIRRKRRRWARKFLASGPWIHQPMIHDGTELKKLIPAWGA